MTMSCAHSTGTRVSDEVTLESLVPIVGIIAKERTRSWPDKHDDAVQEGMIAAWQVLQKRPDAPRSYVVGAIRNRVTASSMGRASFGKPPMRGRQQVDAMLLDDLSSVDEDTVDPWQAVDTAMDVQAAMELWSSEQRKLAFLVFYQDMTLAEASAWLGKAPQWAEREMRYIREGEHRTSEERMSRAQSQRAKKRYES